MRKNNFYIKGKKKKKNKQKTNKKLTMRDKSKHCLNILFQDIINTLNL